jgi:hypothetical protein
MPDQQRVDRMYDLALELTDVLREYKADLQAELVRRGHPEKVSVVVNDWLVPACDSMLKLIEDDFMPYLNRIYNTGTMMNRKNFEQDIVV